MVGVDHAPPAPLCFGLPGEADFRGFEIDMLAELATQLDVHFDYTSALWSRILTELQAGRIDLICTAATITEARRGAVAFSQPYLDSSLVLVTRRGGPPINSHSLEGARVGVRVATVAESFVRKAETADTVRTFDLNVLQYQALRDGEVDVVVDDGPIAGYFTRTVAGLALGPAIPGTEFQYGLVFARGNDELRVAVDAGLEQLRARGTLAALRRRWLE